MDETITTLMDSMRSCKSLGVSQSHHSIDVLDILSTWSSTDLCDVAWFATVEAKTTMRVFLHQVGAVQVHRLGGWRHCSSRRLGEGGGCGSGGSDNRRGAEQGWLSSGSLWVSQNCLHWLSSREVLRFHSAQVVGIGSSW